MAQYELNLRDYLRIFRKRKFTIIITFIVTMLFSAIYFSEQDPIYEASTTIKIQERKTVAGLLTEWIIYTPGNIMKAQAEIIKGYPTMKKTAIRLKLIDEKSSLASIHQAITDIRGRIEIESVKSTNIIKIIAISNDPEEALELANAVAEAYMEQNLLEKNKQARTVRKFVEEQLSLLKERLLETEKQLVAFGEEVENIGIMEPIQEKLVDLEFMAATLSQKYTEKHPKILQLKQQIKELKQEIKGLSVEQLEYSRLKREAEVNKKLYAMLKEKLEQARITEAEKVGDISIIDPAVLPISPINPPENLGILVGAFAGLILGCIVSFIKETLDTSIGTIEDVEKLTKLPVLGVVPSMDYELKKKEKFFKRVISRFSRAKKTSGEEDQVRLIVQHKPNSSIAESFRNIRTNLKISSSKKAILVTSAQPKEGKTTTVINLGLVTAQEGLKTLLVSADLRRPVLAKTFGIKSKPGLTEVLTGAVSLEKALRSMTDVILGEMEFEDAIKSPGLRNIWLLPAGDIPRNPAGLISLKEMVSVIDQLRQRFDVVFFDSPPILPVTDPSILAPLLDTVVLCYEIGRTSKDALLRAEVQLKSVNANISGVILNHIKPQIEAISPYPYYKYKYKYYKEETEKGTTPT